MNPATFAASLELALGEPILEVSEVKTGYVNKAFTFHLSSGKKFCKISPLWYQNSLARERWCLQQLTTLDIPVPSVFRLFEKLPQPLEGREALVLDFVDGSLLSTFPKIETSVLDQLAKVYRVMHRQMLTGYGWLDQQNRGTKHSWKEFLLDIENLDICRSASSAWRQRLDFLLGELDRSVQFSSPGSLLYGDFNLDNFIIRPDGLLVAFDFQNCFSGDPLYDLSAAVERVPELEDVLLFQGIAYERPRALLYAMRAIVSKFIYFLQQQNLIKVGEMEHRFTSLFQLYKKY